MALQAPHIKGARMEPITPPPVTPSIPPAAPAATWPREPRRLSAGRGASWWGEGWKIFTAAPLPWLGMIVVVFVINVVLGFIPIIGSLASMLLGPIFAGGLLLGCHALARGQTLEFTHLFEAFRSDRLMPLLILGLIALGIGLVVMLVFGMLFVGAGMTGMMTGVMSQDPGAGMMGAMAGMGGAALVAGLLGLVIGVLFFMAWWFAPALVTLSRAAPVEALTSSFRAAAANIGAIVVFVLIFFGLAIVASIPFGLGWLVLGPVFVGASYASWREVFGD
jgi:uncharacterized membrane protein